MHQKNKRPTKTTHAPKFSKDKNAFIKLDSHQIVNHIIMGRDKCTEKIMNNAPAFQSCLAKQAQAKQLFGSCATPEQKYIKIIELGRSLPQFCSSLKTDDRLVKGCQSRMYLSSSFSDGKVLFQLDSEALISAGLGALLLFVYNGETPEAILSCPPLFLEELEIHKSLSPSRSNGLASLLLRMKQEALNFLVTKSRG